MPAPHWELVAVEKCTCEMLRENVFSLIMLIATFVKLSTLHIAVAPSMSTNESELI